MDDVKVSVCITTYNQEQYIAQAVESVLAQRVTFPMEIVIGEDCSTDRTPEILRELASKNPQVIQLKLGTTNIGGKANFMATKARCRGQYIAMLEGDDYWNYTDKLQRQIDALDSHPEWAMCFHPCVCLYEEGMTGIPIYPIDWTKPVATINDLFISNFIPTGSLVFRNHLFKDFPVWFGDLLIGDWPLNILNAEHGDIGFMPELMSTYRRHPRGVWSGATEAERLVAVFAVFSAIDHHFAGKYTQHIEQYRADAIRHLFSQLDSATKQVSQVAQQLGSAHAQIEAETLTREHTEARADAEVAAQALAQEREAVRANRLESQLRMTRADHQWLVGEFTQLQFRYAELEQNTRSLLDFYHTTRKSIIHRIEREVRRPFRRLRKYLQGAGKHPTDMPTDDTAHDKAA